MTERETLEKCRDMWNLIAQGVEKEEAAQIIAQTFEARPSHNCFCCEYVRLLFGRSKHSGMACSSNIRTTQGKNMLERCPLHELWPNGCEADNSVYILWEDAEYRSEPILAAKYALQIVAECERLINFANEKSTQSNQAPASGQQASP